MCCWKPWTCWLKSKLSRANQPWFERILCFEVYFAEELGLKTDLDFKSDLHKQIYNSINKKKYLEYKDKYIISNKSDPNKLFWDIFLDEICLINKKYSEKWSVWY